MKIDRAGYPFIAAALLPAVGLAASRRRGWAVPFAALAAFFAYFWLILPILGLTETPLPVPEGISTPVLSHPATTPAGAAASPEKRG